MAIKVCRHCGWRYDDYVPEEVIKTQRIEDICPHCGSEDVVPPINPEIYRAEIIDLILSAQAHFNKAYELIEPLKEAIDNLQVARSKLYEAFDYASTDDNWKQIIDSDAFYSFTKNDEKETIYNATVGRIEEV